MSFEEQPAYMCCELWYRHAKYERVDLCASLLTIESLCSYAACKKMKDAIYDGMEDDE